MKYLILVIFLMSSMVANAQAYFKGGNLIVSPTGKAGIGTTSPQVILDIQGTTSLTSSILLPRGTTANRHAGVNGMLRYNTNTSVFEGYSNGSWSTLGSGGGGSGVTYIGTGTGLVPNTITGTGTLVVDVGTTASKIVQFTSTPQYPAVDGFLISNFNTANLHGGGSFTSSINSVQVVETVVAAGTCSTSYNVNPTLGTMINLTLNGACAIGVTGLVAGHSYTIKLSQTSTTAPTFTSAYKWQSAVAPTWSVVNGKFDIVSCVSLDGSTLDCSALIDVR